MYTYCTSNKGKDNFVLNILKIFFSTNNGIIFLRQKINLIKEKLTSIFFYKKKQSNQNFNFFNIIDEKMFFIWIFPKNDLNYKTKFKIIFKIKF